MLDFSALPVGIGLLGFVVLTQSSIYKEYLDLMGYRSLEIIFYIEDIQAPTDIPVNDHF